jgi:hypothetical protein
MIPNAKGFFSIKAILPSKKRWSTNKFITLRLYEHQIYNLDWGTSAPKK